MTAQAMIAFIGPSIPRDEAAELCPNLDIRPPIRRGDLYYERERGAWGFLIIDGFFMAEQAVSPREVVEVLADGALVVGASSMGALRAADCWPAGAIGIGVIYRLYRSRILDSDEEVAVAVRADGTDLAGSVALVNVRYAVSRAVRRRLLDCDTARKVLQEAASIYYPERTWPEVLRRARVTSQEVHQFCGALDLKRNDAKRALAYARGLLFNVDVNAARHRRTNHEPFARSEDTRERGYDVYGGIEPERLVKPLFDWLVGSGRIVRYRSRHDLARAPSREAYARRLWDDLARAGELEAELMRMRAIKIALAEAQRKGLDPRPGDVRIARREIASNYGFMSWDLLLDSEFRRRFALAIEAASKDLARAKRVRDAWFNP